jgi:hypothetical protein
MPEIEERSKDLNTYSQQTTKRLIFGGIIIAVIIGTLLIMVFYGGRAGISGFLCILVGFIPIILTFVLFLGINYLVTKYRK